MKFYKLKKAMNKKFASLRVSEEVKKMIDNLEITT